MDVKSVYLASIVILLINSNCFECFDVGARAVNDYSLSFQKKLGKEASKSKNVISSPLSVFTAFSALALGADGETRSEMEKALKWDNNVKYFNLKLAVFFNTLTAGSKELAMTNKIFSAADFKIERSYMLKAKKYFGMRSENIDFSEPDNALKMVNGWVKRKTRGLIPKLFPQGSFDSLTRMALVNVIHFKSDWQKAFDKKKTRKGVFQAPSGPVKVKYMTVTNKFRMANLMGKKGKILQLPFKGNKFAMYFLLPEGSVHELENSMSVEKLNEAVEDVSNTREIKMRVTIPKFKIKFKKDLKGEFMEMSKVFSQDANLSKLSKEGGIYVSTAIHKAVMVIDESGAEAAAATGIGIRGRMVGPPPFYCDKPFLFYLIHQESGAIVFSGKVMNPNK